MQYKIENWEDVSSYEGYYKVSNMGNVISVERDIIQKDGKVKRLKSRNISSWANHRGYLLVTISKNGIKKSVPVHILVCQAFWANPQNKPEVNHIDGDKKNNSHTNLEWSTRVENIEHSRNVLGNIYEGESHSLSKLTEHQVRRIIELHKTGKYTFVSLANQFNMEETQIHRIVKRISWKHLKIA